MLALFRNQTFPTCVSRLSAYSIFSMSNNSIPGIPCSAGLSMGTAKNLNLAILSYVLFLLYTQLFAQCLADCVFYCDSIFLAGKATTVDLGNKIPKILNGIRLPLLPVSVLYIIHALFD